ncbi:hypothetical protein BB558_000437 [Smittium angustum]|uniref:Uncharacterized protein n=1 Tax=Smittium angustum TaxID=133377 RepID=A0A2U1JE74_SMIAN|nr:hypothetical protein BB558_000437 [Smittium angustum]
MQTTTGVKTNAFQINNFLAMIGSWIQAMHSLEQNSDEFNYIQPNNLLPIQIPLTDPALQEPLTIEPKLKSTFSDETLKHSQLDVQQLPFYNNTLQAGKNTESIENTFVNINNSQDHSNLHLHSTLKISNDNTADYRRKSPLNDIQQRLVYNIYQKYYGPPKQEIVSEYFH